MTTATTEQQKTQTRNSDNLSVNTNMNNSNSFEDSAFVELEEKTVTAEEVLEGLHLTPEEMLLLERDTRSQSICLQLYEARCIGITGSKCGRITVQKEIVTLLRFCLYPKLMLYLPKPIAWGRENEPKAQCKYFEHMQTNGHLG